MGARAGVGAGVADAVTAGIAAGAGGRSARHNDSTLDLFRRDLVVLAAGDGAAWREAAAEVAAGSPGVPLRVRSVGPWLRDADGSFAQAYRLADGGAVLVRPDGVVAWRSIAAPADHARALAAAARVTLGRGTDADRALLGDPDATTVARAA